MKPFAVESRITYIKDNKTDIGSWRIWNKYKTLKSMFQGLSDMRKNDNISYWRTSANKEIIICKFIWQFRPVHSI